MEEVGKGVETLGVGNPKATEDIAKLKLVTATQELLGTVRPPQDAIMGWFAYMGIVSAVHVFQDWKVFDAILPAGSISYAELAEKVHAEEAVLCEQRPNKSWFLPCGYPSSPSFSLLAPFVPSPLSSRFDEDPPCYYSCIDAGGQKLTRGLSASVIVRISWMLTSTSILRHHASGHISHTPVSLLLRETEPMGSMFKVM